jgi:hypothetical protein
MSTPEYPEPIQGWDYDEIDQERYNLTDKRKDPTFGWYVKYWSTHPGMHKQVLEFARTWKPLNVGQLVLEWPYVSETDCNRIAFTPSIAHGKADRQTITTLAKFLQRHWPHVPDHVKRDFCAVNADVDFRTYNTELGIIAGVELGPQSCMKSAYGSIPFGGDDHHALCQTLKRKGDYDMGSRLTRHPYIVYQPKYGWRMVTRERSGEVLGRCLVNEADDRVFVRSYQCTDSYSGSDAGLEAWLVQQGYHKLDAWPDGLKLAKFPHPQDHQAPLLPYLDGCDRDVSDEGGFFVIDRGGAYTCDNTDGTATYEDNQSICDDCGARVDSDEMTSVAGGDRDVCSSCIEDYRECYVGHGDYEYVHVDQAIRVSEHSSFRQGEWMDGRNLPDEWVEDVDGEAIKAYECVEINGDYYAHDHDDVRCLHDGEYALETDCVELADGELALSDDTWKCEESGDYYLDSDTDEQVEYEGETYHSDNCWTCEDSMVSVPDSVKPVILGGCSYDPRHVQAVLDALKPVVVPSPPVCWTTLTNAAFELCA